MSKILAEISAGEFFDKLSILEIKLNKIKNLFYIYKKRKIFNFDYCFKFNYFFFNAY